MLLDALFLSHLITNSCMPDLFLWYWHFMQLFILFVFWVILLNAVRVTKDVLDFVSIFDTFKIQKMGIAYIYKISELCVTYYV